MGCPRGHEHDPIYSLSICTRAFWANFSLSFPRKRLQWEKKIVVPVFGCNNERLFPEKFSFYPKSARKYCASAP